MSPAVERVYAALERCGCDPRPNGSGYKFKCPVHPDAKPSGSLGIGDDGRALLWCGAGCPCEAIVARLGLDMADLFEAGPRVERRIVAAYDYHDENGELLYQVVRFDPKDFRQRRPDGDGWAWNMKGVRRALYRLPDVLDAVQRDALVYVVEGERDADSINASDPDAGGAFVATCNVGGAGKWRPEYSETLRGARVVIVADKDEPGRRHALDVRASLQGVAASVAIVEAKTGKDASDHLAVGHALDELVPYSKAPAEPPAQERLRVWVACDLRAILTEKPRDVRFIVDRLIAEDDGCVLTAAPKDGKTYLAASIAIECALGRRVFGRYDVQAASRVLWLDEEMGIVKLQRRLQRLARGLELGEDELGILATNLRLFPQQGLTLTAADGVREFHAEVDEFKPGLVIVDSFAAVTAGIDDSNPERRAFYRNAIAPLRRMGTACLLLAHPPLPNKDQHADARKRPRGGGDILGTCDRALYLEKVSEETIACGRVVTVTLGELFSREGCGLDGLDTVTIEDVAEGSTVVRSSGGELGAVAATLGKTNAASRELLHLLRTADGGEMYQADAKKAMERLGYGSTVVKDALAALKTQALVELLPAREGRSGKWLRATEADA